MTESLRHNIAVFIDFENFGCAQSFNAKQLVSALKERGRLVVKKAYADWGRYAGYKQTLLENSIELIEMPSHKHRGKNSADIKLTVDALETAIHKEYIGTFVVFSGDSDYLPLIAKLREYNKYVIVIGIADQVSKLMGGYCDELIDYHTLLGNAEPLDNGTDYPYRLLKRVVTHLDNEGVDARGSMVKQYMRQFDSSFNERQYGFKQFKTFLVEAERRKMITLARDEHGDLVAGLVANGHNGHNGHNSHNGHNGTSKPAPANSTSGGDVSKIKPVITHAITLLESIPVTPCRLSLLGSVARQLEPDFSLPNYGYAKSKGLKQILPDLADEQLITYELDPEINDYVITAQSALHDYAKTLEQPASYALVWYKTLLASLSLYVDPSSVNTVITIVRHLQAKIGRAIFLHEFQSDWEAAQSDINNVDTGANPITARKVEHTLDSLILADAMTIRDDTTLILNEEPIETAWNHVLGYIVKRAYEETGHHLEPTLVEQALTKTK